MATKDLTPQVVDQDELHVLFDTIEELAISALNIQGDSNMKEHDSLLWSIQKLARAGAITAASMDNHSN